MRYSTFSENVMTILHLPGKFRFFFLNKNASNTLFYFGKRYQLQNYFFLSVDIKIIKIERRFQLWCEVKVRLKFGSRKKWGVLLWRATAILIKISRNWFWRKNCKSLNLINSIYKMNNTVRVWPKISTTSVLL